MPSISFQTFFVQTFRIVVNSWKLTMLLLHILCDDWPIFMISGLKEQLQQELKYTLLKPDCHSWWISIMQSGCEEERYAIKFCFKLGKNAMRWKLDLLLWPRDQETEFPVEACWLSQTPEGQTVQIHPQTFDDPFFETTGMIYMHWVPTGQTVNKEYYVEVLREFRKRFHKKRPILFKSALWHFHQDNAPVHNSILVTDYLTPSSLDLVPCAETVVIRQLRRWKRLWRRSLTRWHKRTSMGPSRGCWNSTTSALQPEEIILKGSRVSCVYYQ